MSIQSLSNTSRNCRSKISNILSDLNNGRLSDQPSSVKPKLITQEKQILGSVDEKIPLPKAERLKVDTLLITPNEVNLNHGTGVLLSRIFSGKSVLNVRAESHYQNNSTFADYVMPQKQGPLGAYRDAVRLLETHEFKNVLCVPFFEDDYLNAIAIKEVSGCPMGVWVMDDHLFHDQTVPIRLAESLFQKADVLYAISPEMVEQYQNYFGLKFNLLPPTVSHHHRTWVETHRDHAFTEFPENRFAIVGNIWSRKALDHLITTIKESSWSADWFGLASKAPFYKTSKEELESAGIYECGLLDESELLERLKAYPFVVVPTGSAMNGDTRKSLTKFSLPTKIPFVMCSETPMLVLGDHEGCSSRFVDRFDVGLHCEYEPTHFVEAAKQLKSPDLQSRLRKNAQHHAAGLWDDGLYDWLIKGIQHGEVDQTRFETSFGFLSGDVLCWRENKLRKPIFHGYEADFKFLNRLKKTLHYQPDFVIDVGASNGIWSHYCHMVFPDAHYVLAEPMLSFYEKKEDMHSHPGFQWIPKAVADREGTMTFLASNDGFGSSLLEVCDGRNYLPQSVEVTTVEAIYHDCNLSGSGILKIDVQLAEHLVLRGAEPVMGNIDYIIVETNLDPSHASDGNSLLKIQQDLLDLGFSMFDMVGTWRNSRNGNLEQIDIVFRNINPKHPR